MSLTGLPRMKLGAAQPADVVRPWGCVRLAVPTSLSRCVTRGRDGPARYMMAWRISDEA